MQCVFIISISCSFQATSKNPSPSQPTLSPHYHLTSSSCLLIESSLCCLYTHGYGPLTGATYYQSYSQRKTTLPSPDIINSPARGRVCEPVPIHAGIWSSLVLLRSCSGTLRCCGFMIANGHVVAKGQHFTALFVLQLWHSFCSMLWDVL